MQNETTTMNTTDLDKLILDSIGKGQEIIVQLILDIVKDEKFREDDFLDWCMNFLKTKNICCGNTKPKELIRFLKRKYEPKTTDALDKVASGLKEMGLDAVRIDNNIIEITPHKDKTPKH